MAEHDLLIGTGGEVAVLPIEVRLARLNRRHIGQWLWVAHHMIREGEPVHAYEAMLSASLLMGAHESHDAQDGVAAQVDPIGSSSGSWVAPTLRRSGTLA